VRLSIGEFSIVTRLSKKALRHYHEVGLLEPAQIDPATGYRHYDTSQVRVAQVIRRFRDLNMPVPDVKAVLAAPDIDARNEIIAAHLRHMESQLDQVRAAVGALRELLDPVPEPIEVEFRSVPVVRAAAISATVGIGEITAWWQAALDEIHAALRPGPASPAGGLYAPELFTDEVGEATVFVPTTSPIQPAGRVRMLDIPAAELAVAVHEGPHSTIDRTYGALGTFVTERLLAVDGPVRENYLVIGDSVEARGQRTEICWPIFQTSAG
jgi:DNA-binding transcriptional MerR regulator/effector-binding domain-containing protein